MRTRKLVLSVWTLLLFVSFAYAQVTGVVVDDFGPIAGAEVTVDNTDVSTYTDDAGIFTIDANIGDNLTIINPTNLAETKVKVRSMDLGEIVSGQVIGLADVLVLGYDQTTTKEESIGASTTISEESFEGRPSVSFLSSVQGSSPGVMIQTSSGSPGSAKIDALIRGQSSINSSTEPLYVIDGVMSGSNQFRNLNQNDIASVTILRDAHATSIYGNNGANGVIVITTKSGKFNQDLKISLSTSYGIFTLPDNDYNVADAKQMLTLQKRVGQGFGSTLTDDEIANWGIDTDWLDVFFQEGTNQQYNLTLSQGSENFSSYTSLGYMEVQGMVPTTDFQRFTARTKIDGKSTNEKLKYGVVLAPAYSKRHQLDVETRSGIRNNIIQNPLQGSMVALPYLESGIYSNGQELFDAIGSDFSAGKNIYVLEDILIPGQMPNQHNEFSIMGNGYLSYEFLEGLTARTRISVDYKHQQRMFARAPWSYLAIVVANSNNTEFGGNETIWNDQDFTFSNINSLHYDKVFDDVHELSLGAFMEYVKAHNQFSYRRQNGLNPRTWELGAGTGYITRDGDNYIPDISASKVTGGSFSYFGTLDYTYDEKYGIGANIRRDASFRFVDDNKWGTFWSVGGRWNIDKEPWLEDVEAINMLKLRASYGTQGNSVLQVVPYDYNPLFLGLGVALDQNQTGAGYMNQNAYYTNIGNNELQWEEVKQGNIGLDFILFKNKLEGNVDVYKKVTEKLFNSLRLSALTGQYTIEGNNGELENRGIEMALRYHIFDQEDFDLSIFGNASYNKNEIIALDSEDIAPGGTVNAIGGPAYQWNVYEYLGVNPENGNLLFADADGNPTETPDPEADAKLTEKTALPSWLGGFGLNAEYKGFYLDVNFTYQTDVWKYDNQLQWLYDSSPSSLSGYAASADLLDAWTDTNTDGSMPALSANNIDAQGDSDRFLTDASFVKLRNISFGYSIPREWLEPTFVDTLEFFVQAENLATWSDWKGFDPEGYTATALGVYPSPRTISLGFNVEF